MAALPSTRAAPIRRFIYLIVNGADFSSHTLHRIDTSPLFAAAGVGVGVGVRAHQGPGPPPPSASLPRPLARFDRYAGPEFFPLGLGSSMEKIVSVDRNQHTVIFDTSREVVLAGPDARHEKWNYDGSTWAEADGRLYHLGRSPGYEAPPCLDFEALTYDHHRDDWFWSILPPPPFERYTDVTIESFADAGAGDASAIRISTTDEWDDGTYTFDAARASWHKEGDWALPFRGRAQYVADYGLWFGFTDDGASDLCAADLNVAGRPACRHVWADVDGNANRDVRGGWLLSYLSYMGSGRFCVTRFFRETDNDGSFIMTAVVTAVEAMRTAASATGELQMVSRASVRYHSPEWNSPYWAY